MRRTVMRQTPDASVVNCGADNWQPVAGQEVKFNAEILNSQTGDDDGILVDIVWLLDGNPVARNDGFEVGPDRTRWGHAFGVPSEVSGVGVGDQPTLTVQLENVRWKHPDRH